MTVNQTPWRKSSHSGSGNTCVEVAPAATGHILLRDSTDPTGPILHVTPTAFRNLLTQART